MLGEAQNISCVLDTKTYRRVSHLAKHGTYASTAVSMIYDESGERYAVVENAYDITILRISLDGSVVQIVGDL